MSASLIFYFYYPFEAGAFGRTKSDLKWQAFWQEIKKKTTRFKSESCTSFT